MSTRILRIGVIVGGAIIEERLVRDRGPVELDGHALFVVAKGEYELRLGAGMDGRVSEGEGVRAIGPGTRVPLGAHARGRVVIGEVTVLFQMVAEPPEQPAPVLPASVRGRLGDRIDPRLAVIETLSVTVCLAVALAAWLHDRPERRDTWGTRTTPFETETVDLTELAATMPDEVAIDEAPAETAAPARPAETPAPAVSTRRSRPAAPEADAAALQEEATRYAAALAAEREGDVGVDGPMSDAAPSDDLAEQIAETRKSRAKVEVGGNAERAPRETGAPRPGTHTEIPVDDLDGPETIGPHKPEREPTERIVVARPKPYDDTTLTPATVHARIVDVYLRGLQRCYSKLLVEQPGARGAVDVSFTVNESGRVTEPAADTAYDSLSRCVATRMTTWTFPIPKDDEQQPTTASFALTLALQPD